MSLAARSSQGGPFLSFQGSIGAAGSGDQHNAMHPVVGQPMAKQPMDGNGARIEFYGGQSGGDFMEKDSPPGSRIENKGPSSFERISMLPTPLPRTAQREGQYRDDVAGTVICLCMNACMYNVCVCMRKGISCHGSSLFKFNEVCCVGGCGGVWVWVGVHTCVLLRLLVLGMFYVKMILHLRMLISS